MSGLFYTLKRWRLSVVFILKSIKILYLTIFAVPDRSAAFNQLLIVLNDIIKKKKKPTNSQHMRSHILVAKIGLLSAVVPGKADVPCMLNYLLFGCRRCSVTCESQFPLVSWRSWCRIHLPRESVSCVLLKLQKLLRKMVLGFCRVGSEWPLAQGCSHLVLLKMILSCARMIPFE